MNNRRRYRCVLCFLLIVCVLLLAFAVRQLLCSRIPDEMTVAAYGEIPELFPHPVDEWVPGEIIRDKGEANTKAAGMKTEKRTDGRKLQAKAEDTGKAEAVATAAEDGTNGCRQAFGDPPELERYEIKYTLFGKIPLKTVQACVAAPKKVYVGGTPIGMYLRTAGVLVVGTDAIHAMDGDSCCPAGGVLQAGDYIRTADGQRLATKEELIDCFDASEGKTIQLQVERDGELRTCSIAPVMDDSGTYRAGVWVRNDTQGIGTLTYVNEEGHFGALGHGISDIDTGKLLKIDGGTLYDADVVSVVRGQEGAPGELAGVIHYSEGYKIGVIEENNKNGIYGTISGFSLLADQMDQYEIAYRQSVKTGPAQILCTVGDSCRTYDAQIREVRRTGADINKGIVLEITDEALLERTGGIVQGMSGSPILQDGKLIGAVTHVFVNAPTKGYGIFIEDMVEH